MGKKDNEGVIVISLPFITHSKAIQRLRNLCNIKATYIDKVELYDIRDELMTSEEIASCFANLLGKHVPSQVVLDSMKKIIDYHWDSELMHFCADTGYEPQSQDSLPDWIIELRRLGQTDHIFYHMMVLKDYLNSLTK